VVAEKKEGYIDKKGKVVIKPVFDEADEFNNGIAWVSIGRKSGYIDRKGKWIWSYTYRGKLTLDKQTHKNCTKVRSVQRKNKRRTV
jgi:hypothetical protein